MRPTPAYTLVMALAAATQIAWLDRHTLAREGSRLYTEGKYDEAAEKYNQALVDDPDAGLLHYNLGAILYKQGKFGDAIGSYEKVPPAPEDPQRAARVAYNVGNARFREGQAAAASDPKTALAKYAEALVAYRRAMGADPGDLDVKFNHEFVQKALEDLKKKLEEEQQKKEQEQKEQQEQQQGDQQQEQKDEQQPPEQGDQEDQQQQRQEEQAQQPEEQKDEQQQEEQPQRQPGDQQQAEEKPDEQQQAQGGEAGEQADQPEDGKMSQREAAALLDSQRDQEVRPDEMVRRLQGAAVAEPREDW